MEEVGNPEPRGGRSKTYKEGSSPVEEGFSSVVLLVNRSLPSHNYPLVTIAIIQLYLVVTTPRPYLNVDTPLSLNRKAYRRRP